MTKKKKDMNFPEALGISSKRAEEINAFVAKVKLNPDYKVRSDEAIAIIKACKTQRELFYAGTAMRAIEEKMKKIAGLAKMFGDC